MTNDLTIDREPIAALASAAGAAAVSLIRVSGEHCHELLKPLLAKPLSNPIEARSMRRRDLIDPKTKDVIDDVMVCPFVGPSSFTGQDAVEIYCHGGPYIVRRILETLFQAGFRQAEPGEFTRRAFLNGKMDLAQAEGIAGLVSALSEHQWQSARMLAGGRLTDHVQELRRQLVEAMAFLEAQIDFPDEGDVASQTNMQQAHARVAKVTDTLNELAGTYDDGKVARNGLMVALVGAPNAGKSTLMNALLGSERAIVTDIAGTTRDYLEESCLLKGRLLRLVDTAGIRSEDEADHVEKIGIAASRKMAQEADLVLFLAPADSPEDPRTELDALAKDLGVKRSTLLVTKSDLAKPSWATAELCISAEEQGGLQGLIEYLVQQVDDSAARIANKPALVNARHRQAVAEAQDNLAKYAAARDEGAYEDMLAFELQQTARALGSIIGAIDNEDILDKIFSTFCVGK